MLSILLLILGKARNFKRYTHVLERKYRSRYDYGSIMHYPRRAFSKNGRDTIVPKNPRAVIGQRRGLSRTDIDEIKKFYQCGKENSFSTFLYSERFPVTQDMIRYMLMFTYYDCFNETTRSQNLSILTIFYEAIKYLTLFGLGFCQPKKTPRPNLATSV